jgi:hypothetical protein
MSWTKLDFAMYYLYLQTACLAIGAPPEGPDNQESDDENTVGMIPQRDSNLVVKGAEQLSEPAPAFQSFDSLCRHDVRQHWQECQTLQVRWCADLKSKDCMQRSS